MTLEEFKATAAISWDRVIEEACAAHCGAGIKKKETLARNLGNIFNAALRLSNEKGFAAMSMRDLSREAGLSLGALYAYFKGKDDLLAMLMQTGRQLVFETLGRAVQGGPDASSRLAAALRTHLFLSELMQPWFFFAYMEARRLSPQEKARAVAGEEASERLLADIIEEGRAAGEFRAERPLMAAAALKALLQDWYLKRGKHSRRGVSVDEYADFVVNCAGRMLETGADLERTTDKDTDHGTH